MARWLGRFWRVAFAMALASCGSKGTTSTSAAQEPQTPATSSSPTPPPPPTTTPPSTPTPPAFQFGTPGPWPVANVTYGTSDGIQELPVIGMTTDENQNRWVATHQALYLMRPGDKAFHRYDASDGLHLAANPGHYCNDRPIPKDQRCTSVETWGAATDPGITVIAGGGRDEVFVGYHGSIDDTVVCPPKDPTIPQTDFAGDYCDPLHHSGKIDRVRLNADGTLTVDRFDLVANNHGANYWHDRWVQRLLYDHFTHAHTLYAGTNHGVAILFPDKFRYPNPGEWFDQANQDWMGDHLHARVCFEKPCDDSGANQRMGDWRGLALDPNGDLWHAGKWAAGLITWDADPWHWFERNGAAFKLAFGDPYGGPGSGNQPVFPVAKEGHDVNLTAVAVCPDGKVWFASSGVADGVAESVASWERGKGFQLFRAADLGLPEAGVTDLVCLPDGRLVLGGSGSGLAIWDPSSGSTQRIRAADGLIPGDGIEALEVDHMVSPLALNVATSGGAAVLRSLP